MQRDRLKFVVVTLSLIGIGFLQGYSLKLGTEEITIGELGDRVGGAVRGWGGVYPILPEITPRLDELT